MKKNLSVQIIASLFILLFAYTALSKFMAGDTFRFALRRSPLISDWAGIVAWAIPTLELVAVFLLFVPTLRRTGLFASLGLMTLFTLYIAYMLAFTPKLPCSCGGIIQSMSWKTHLAFNIVFTALAAFALWLDRPTRPFGLQQSTPRRTYT